MARDPTGDGSIALSQVVGGDSERRLAGDSQKVPLVSLKKCLSFLQYSKSDAAHILSDSSHRGRGMTQEGNWPIYRFPSWRGRGNSWVDPGTSGQEVWPKARSSLHIINKVLPPPTPKKNKKMPHIRTVLGPL